MRAQPVEEAGPEVEAEPPIASATPAPAPRVPPGVEARGEEIRALLAEACAANNGRPPRGAHRLIAERLNLSPHGVWRYIGRHCRRPSVPKEIT